jgi:molybdenum cofactor cytidylyltransferase
VIAAVIIASGFSRRMGRSKLDLEIGGRTFLQRAIDAARGARALERCLVVVRPEDESKVQERRSEEKPPPLNPRSVPPGFGAESLESGPPLDIMLNPEAELGQSASIRLAVERLTPDPTVEAAIFSVVDQPFLTSDIFERLIESWKAGAGEILVSSYDGQRGNPVLFARRFFGELSQLTGDVGGREVIRGHPEAVRAVPMPDPAAGEDVDTWEDYELARGRADE